ncbi:MAG: hypothetical protein PSV23_03740 [Brevundimonas sp.]|uniref:hypothetical protein n=1 Tax=Brevundimonas sp. TaxID=1871086 RepID=UPI0024889583|nr:hypothetical protein [Brevundimonas sp.]MDI1325894.1 hypothetical protein [Brevundimonas sp.]
MRPFDLLRALTPPGWSLVVALAVAAALTLGHGLGLRWDPFNLAERRLAAAETRASTAAFDAAARRLEFEGAARQARRIDLHHQQADSVARATDRAAHNARIAHDASLPLDPARAARLREHDRRLCDLAPAVCATAPADPARGGDHAVSAGPAA